MTADRQLTAGASPEAVHLQLDVGNTRLKWRLLSLSAGEPDAAAMRVLGRGFLVMAEYSQPGDALSALNTALQPLLDGSGVASLRVATVAAWELSRTIACWAQQWKVEAQFAYVTPKAAGVTAGYDNPSVLGVDRWLAVLAAARYRAEGVMVVDCGSAVTVDLLHEGQHSGGYIVPGLRLMNRALFGDTARVKVQAQWSSVTPAAVAPGRNTAAAVSGGLSLMVVGLIQEVLRRQQAQTGQIWKVLLCGGDARFIAALLPAEVEFQVVDDLVLDGLMWAAVRPLDLASDV